MIAKVPGLIGGFLSAFFAVHAGLRVSAGIIWIL